MKNNEIAMQLQKGRSSTTGSLYQYDYGQRLVIYSSVLPETYEVHFSNEQHGSSKTVLGDSTGVAIPDEYLTSGDNIHVWIYLHDGDADGETEYHGIINVIKRAKPTDQEPTPVQQDVITQAIAALNTAVTEAESIRDAIPETVNTALEEAKASGEFDGFSPIANVTKVGDTATISITDKEGTTAAQISDGPKGDKGDPGDDGHSPVVTASKSGKVTTISVDGSPIATINDGNDGQDGEDGQDGQDGYSPTATVAKSGNTATITITDKNGTTTAQISDGAQGVPGVDGVSPTVDVEPITGGHEVTITDKTGEHTFDVMNGKKGEKGDPGTPGDPTELIDDTAGEGDTDKTWSADKLAGEVADLDTAIGAKYTKPDSGIPATDLESGVIPTVPVQDVQVNGTSILSQGVANLPVASSSELGVIKIGAGLRLSQNGTNQLLLQAATSGDIRSANNTNAVTGAGANAVAFYGLARAAGDTTQQGIVGNMGSYTDEAKNKIQQMLGISDAISDLNLAITQKYTKPASGIPATDLESGVIPAVPVQDVQVNGVSVVQDGVANVPQVTAFGGVGVVKIVQYRGLGFEAATGALTTVPANDGHIKSGITGYAPIIPLNQHVATFYGLAKAAGADMKDIVGTTVGVYPDAQKTAIKEMLGVQDGLKVVRLI